MGEGVGVCVGGGGIHSLKPWSGVGEGMGDGVGVLRGGPGGVSELSYVN